MWTTSAPILASICLFVAVPAPAVDKADAAPANDGKKQLPALEQRILGSWKGQGPCDGRLVFRADGTYEITEYGPAADDTKGAWKIRGDALPANLVLTCKTSEIPKEIGTTLKVTLIKLDDKSLVIEYANQNGSPSGRYARVKK